MSDLEPRRTSDQNRLMWPLLTDWSRSILWRHQVKGVWETSQLPPLGWKHVLTAAFEGCTDMAESLDGRGLVMIGASTSNYGVRKFSDFITFIYAEGIERGVKFSDKSETIRQEHGAKT